MHTLKWFLWPFSLLYLLITECRNFLFDQGFLSSHKADIKTLVIGNLAIGGSGKTPLTIWFIQEMMKENQIATMQNQGEPVHIHTRSITNEPRSM